MNPDLQAALVTLRLALVTTLVLLVIATPLAWWLSRTRSRIRPVVDALVALPLVLPPTVLGFYLLLLLGAQGPFGGGLAFTFSGLVIGSVLYSMPFVVQPIQDAFLRVGQGPQEVAATLGAGPLDRFRHVVLPLARQGFITAAVLGFAHTVGEFGVVLMIGGSIPGETRVLSIAIYEHAESLEFARAHLVAGGLMVVSFVMLLAVYWKRPGLRLR
ncbi:MAG: molybdate ABC transporter permease subunit [Rhodothermales bacterium]|nr:molybdate ABC transporter permease subunit [Rhodothermales bacterium]MBO6780876.1 molybdate ABC transporter permease subunit [Rhodothermales bacterium]